MSRRRTPPPREIIDLGNALYETFHPSRKITDWNRSEYAKPGQTHSRFGTVAPDRFGIMRAKSVLPGVRRERRDGSVSKPGRILHIDEVWRQVDFITRAEERRSMFFSTMDFSDAKWLAVELDDLSGQVHSPASAWDSIDQSALAELRALGLRPMIMFSGRRSLHFQFVFDGYVSNRSLDLISAASAFLTPEWHWDKASNQQLMRMVGSVHVETGVVSTHLDEGHVVDVYREIEVLRNPPLSVVNEDVLFDFLTGKAKEGRLAHADNQRRVEWILQQRLEGKRDRIRWIESLMEDSEEVLNFSAEDRISPPRVERKRGDTDEAEDSCVYANTFGSPRPSPPQSTDWDELASPSPDGVCHTQEEYLELIKHGIPSGQSQRWLVQTKFPLFVHYRVHGTDFEAKEELKRIATIGIADASVLSSRYAKIDGMTFRDFAHSGWQPLSEDEENELRRQIAAAIRSSRMKDHDLIADVARTFALFAQNFGVFQVSVEHTAHQLSIKHERPVNMMKVSRIIALLTQRNPFYAVLRDYRRPTFRGARDGDCRVYCSLALLDEMTHEERFARVEKLLTKRESAVV